MITCPACGEDNPDRAGFCWSCGSVLDSRERGERQAHVRKTVTVLFNDIAGSTSLGERLDPEALRRVMSRYFDEMRAIVESHGGVVEKFIGDAVMAVFGVPRVHEDDALRAVKAAAEMREHLATLNEAFRATPGVQIEARTGINTGRVVAGVASADQRIVTGDTVNIAARLEQAAGPGEILLGEATARLTRDAITAEPVDELALRGKANAVRAWRLSDVTPNAPTQRWRRQSPMVGRERQRRQLGEALEQVEADRVCHLFTVLGSAGVGKSRLVQEFLGDEGAGARILRGRCLSYGEGSMSWALIEAIRGAASISDADTRERVVAAIEALAGGDEQAALIAELVAGAIGSAEVDAPSEQVSWAIRKFFEAMARRETLVLVFDDTHWGTPPFLDLLEQIADLTRDAPILLICIGRQELFEARPTWGGGKRAATTIQLEPLSADESERLLGYLLGARHLDEVASRRITEAAEGNPLFVEEMLAMLIDDGLIRPGERGWTIWGDLADVPVPPTIQALVAARLDRLSVGERIVLGRAAVEGKVFHLGVVMELCPDDVRPAVTTHVRSLMLKDLIRPEQPEFGDDEAFCFRHLVIRDAAYEALPKETRAVLHEHFADRLERRTPSLVHELDELVGYHYEQAARYCRELGISDDTTKALERKAALRLTPAAARASDRGDMRAATNLFSRASELLPEGSSDWLSLQPELGRALFESGDIRRADAMLNDVERLAAEVGDELAGARASVYRLEFAGTAAASPETIVQEADRLVETFERLGDERGVARAGLVGGSHTFQLGHCGAAADRLTRVIEMTRRRGLRREELHALGWLFSALFYGPTPIAEGKRHAEEALEDANGDPVAESDPIRLLARLAMLEGRFGQARALVARRAAIEHELGRSIRSASVAGQDLGPIEMLAGRFEQAARLFREGYDALVSLGHRGDASTIAGRLSHALIELGEIDDAEHYAQLALQVSSPDDIMSQVLGRGALAIVLAERGDFPEAARLSREGVRLAEGTDRLVTHGDALMDLARALRIGSRREEAAAAVRTAIDLYERKGSVPSSGLARKVLAGLPY